MDFGLIFLKRLCDSIDIPKEDARIPEKFAAFDESLRHFEVWLFGEELHPCNLVDSKGIVVRMTVDLYVAVSCLWARGHNADGEQRVAKLRKLQTPVDGLHKTALVADVMVGGRYDDVGVGVHRLNLVTSVCDARRGIAAQRLGEDILVVQFWQLLLDKRCVCAARHNVDVFGAANLRKPVESLLQKRAPRPEDVEKLLGASHTALGPETASNAAQDYDFLYKAGVAAIFGPGTSVAKAACEMMNLLLEK